jgi:hypothetical protein
VGCETSTIEDGGGRYNGGGVVGCWTSTIEDGGMVAEGPDADLSSSVTQGTVDRIM